MGGIKVHHFNCPQYYEFLYIYTHTHTHHFYDILKHFLCATKIIFFIQFQGSKKKKSFMRLFWT